MPKKHNSNVVHVRGVQNSETGEFVNDAQGEGVLVDENGVNVLPWPLPSYYDRGSDGNYCLYVQPSFDVLPGCYILEITLSAGELQYHRALPCEVVVADSDH